MAFLLAAIGIAFASHEFADKVIIPAGEKVISGIEWVAEIPQRVKQQRANAQLEETRSKRRQLTNSIRAKYASSTRNPQCEKQPCK